MYSVSVTGEKAAAAKIAGFRGAVPGIMGVAIVAAGQPVKNLAQGFAPYKTGNLRRSIHVGAAIVTALGAECEVGTNLIYAAPQEFGAHIEPKNYPFLHWVTDDGADVFVWHGVDIPPHPYMRPAADQGAPAAVAAFAQAFGAQMAVL